MCTYDFSCKEIYTYIYIYIYIYQHQEFNSKLNPILSARWVTGYTHLANAASATPWRPCGMGRPHRDALGASQINTCLRPPRAAKIWKPKLVCSHGECFDTTKAVEHRQQCPMQTQVGQGRASPERVRAQAARAQAGPASPGDAQPHWAPSILRPATSRPCPKRP